MRYTKLSEILNPVISALANIIIGDLAGVICTHYKIVFVGPDKIEMNLKINVTRRVFRDSDSDSCRELRNGQAYCCVRGSS